MKSCLIVDDSKIARLFTKKLLEDYSFDSEEAGDGKQALEKCKSSMPDLIILDWNMPEMNGLEFVTKLRREDQGKKPVVIFCSTNVEAEQIETALNAGANEYIMKPFDAEIFKSKLALTGLI